MGAPNTGGKHCNKVAEMNVGDYIKCYYSYHSQGAITSNKAGVLWGLGNETQPNLVEKPVTGEASTSSSKYFYFVKVDKGLLIADRVCQNSISWDILNAGGVIQGKPYSFSTIADVVVEGLASQENILGILRSLGGGNSYATTDGKSSPMDTSNGAWPVDNEWDTYIVRKDYGTGGRDDVWHWNNIATWCQDTPLDGVRFSSGNNSRRTGRGFLSAANIEADVSSKIAATWGFRPVFEYQEVA
ncbi:hypothetical protein C2I27_04225 [Priestia megaterium]|uniref:hypothetical protein n=1 Tax=Priestia megaterium TaxID=1404 RepID=UPI000D50AA4E|nr:hypothetical protein [Priestia megaterium]PVC75099.1 hypothetical protein C2I27_04225 [Priestia megaterium]